MEPWKKKNPFVIALKFFLEGSCPINRKQMPLNIWLLFSPLRIHVCFIINGVRKTPNIKSLCFWSSKIWICLMPCDRRHLYVKFLFLKKKKEKKGRSSWRADKEEFRLEVDHNLTGFQTWDIKNRSKMTILIELKTLLKCFSPPSAGGEGLLWRRRDVVAAAAKLWHHGQMDWELLSLTA